MFWAVQICAGTIRPAGPIVVVILETRIALTLVCGALLDTDSSIQISTRVGVTRRIGNTLVVLGMITTVA